MTRLPVFRLHQPGGLPEALQLLAAAEGVTRVVAGGTDLCPNMKRRHQSADAVISLRNVAELRGVWGEAGGVIRIGALCTL